MGCYIKQLIARLEMSQVDRGVIDFDKQQLEMQDSVLPFAFTLLLDTHRNGLRLWIAVGFRCRSLVFGTLGCAAIGYRCLL
jgi:hypothetical protein